MKSDFSSCYSFILPTCSYDSYSISPVPGGKVYAAAIEDDQTSFTRIRYKPRSPERCGFACLSGAESQVASVKNECRLCFYFAATSYDISKLKPTNYELVIDERSIVKKGIRKHSNK